MPNRLIFGNFELDTSRRCLLRDGERVALNSRAYDLLLELITRRGQILGKDELLERVWSGQIVEEGNLTVQVSALRKLFGEKKDENRYIATVPGHGYSFVAEVAEKKGDDALISSRSFTRIVVEEEIHEPDDIAVRHRTPLGIGPLAPRLRRKRILVFAMIAVAALIAAGLYLLRSYVVSRPAPPFSQMSIKRLTTKGSVSLAAISHDGKLYAYVIPDGGRESLWLGHIDGGEPVEIRPPADLIYLDLKFTPDGSSIYYSVNENFGAGRLYRMPVFGGAAVKIRDDIRAFSFSPDGQRFAFVQDEAGGAYLMTAKADGSDGRKIAQAAGSSWRGPAWSPDGMTVAVIAVVSSDDYRLLAVNVDDGKTRFFTDHSWRRLGGISWLKDSGGLIVVGLGENSLIPQIFSVSNPGGEIRRAITDLNEYNYVTSISDDNSLLALQGVSQSNIWVAPADDLGQAKQVTSGSVGRHDGWNGLAWTPDNRILFSADDQDSTTIWSMNSDGSKQKQLISGGGVNSYPSVASDGGFVVFQSNRNGHFGVWRADLNGDNLSALTGNAPAGQPSLSPDGTWVVYNTSVDSSGQLWRAPTTGGEPVRLMDNASWAVISPDSTMVAAAIEMDGKQKIGILSLNDGRLIRAFEIARLGNVRLGIRWMPDGSAVTYRDWANGIWRQDLSGGEPQRLKGLPEEKLFAYGWSPDGKWFAYTRGTTTRDVVSIVNSK